jgi:uncharacterized protein (TIGR00730 family)
MVRSICIFCGSRDGLDPAHRALAAELGGVLGAAGLTVIYGGGHVGLMGTVADAAIAAGGEVIGLIPARLLKREVGHRDITRLLVTGDMFERKRRMIADADAFVVLPGGFGTLDELLEVLTLRQLGYHDKPIVLINLGGYWNPFIALVDEIVRHKFALPGARTLYRVVDTVDQVLPALGVAQPQSAPLRVVQGD